MSAISDMLRTKSTPIKECIVFTAARGHPALGKDAAAELTAMQARIEKLEAGIRRIINGEYDNARTIDAAEKFARELLRGDK